MFNFYSFSWYNSLPSSRKYFFLLSLKHYVSGNFCAVEVLPDQEAAIQFLQFFLKALFLTFNNLLLYTTLCWCWFGPYSITCNIVASQKQFLFLMFLCFQNILIYYSKMYLFICSEKIQLVHVAHGIVQLSLNDFGLQQWRLHKLFCQFVPWGSIFPLNKIGIYLLQLLLFASCPFTEMNLAQLFSYSSNRSL